MTEDRYTVEDLRDYHDAHGSEERLVCPNCLFAYQGREITDEYDLNFRGFSKEISSERDGAFILAKYGICPCVPDNVEEGSFNIYGTPLILESEYEYNPEFDETDADSQAITLPAQEVKFAFKSTMTAALGEHLSQLEPPYEIARYMSTVVFDTGGEDVKFEKVDEINTKREWFNLLYPYLWDMKNLQAENNQIKFHILPTIYLHKTKEMNHIEPFWKFMNRFGMNLRAVKKSIMHYPGELPPHVQQLVNKNSYEVSRDTIESFTFMSRDTNLIGNLDNKKLREIIDNATKILTGIKNSEYRDGNEKTIFEFISSNQIVSDALEIGGQRLPAAGVIEGFCIFAALSKSDPKIAVDFMQQMYPKKPGSIWEWSLTKFGRQFSNIEAMRKLTQMIDK